MTLDEAYAHVCSFKRQRVCKHTKLFHECGVWSAARYLRKRGYSIEETQDILCLPRRW